MDNLFGGKGQRGTPACIRPSRGIRAFSLDFFVSATRWPSACPACASTAGFPAPLASSELTGRGSGTGGVGFFGAPLRINNV
ncbi:hypothetical protein UCMB321_3288 [Pseudomonas batumici]|uniref:Uncharacterized protein n=1 Tax=Pseudomonas batumici TaxID=226910 RepID=A0A0C2EVS3_9PSED|nr:hypothetical protein UCMB321_3288 [Pseudomonas batumici]